VKVRTTAVGVSVALIAAIALIVSASGSAKNEQAFTMAIVTDIGSLQDKSFNELANKGRLQAQKQLGIKTRVYVTQKAEDRLPNLLAAANAGYSLIFGVGFFHAEHLNTVAPRYPDQKFSGIDVTKFLLESSPANYTGIVFAEQEAGYLVGVAAATVAGGGSVSAVGGQAVPAVVAFLAGYGAGVKDTDPSMTVAQAYSQDFVDQAKCKELALTQIARGSKAVFAAAGGCGLGALQAAKERNVWGIGVDNDQSFLGPHILTSATKKVDVAVFDTIETVTTGTFEGGGDTLYDVANGGVGYGKVSPDAPDRAALIEKLDDVSKQISSGDVKIPRD